MQSAQLTTSNVPTPRDDELALGLLGRVARLNGLPSIAGATKSLKANQPAGKDIPLLWLLAECCQLDPSLFAAKHSMLPVMYPISKPTDGTLEPGRKHFHTRFRGMSLPADRLRWCTECSGLDLKMHGFSYWRRQHQIIGVDWCINHHVPLINTSTEFAIHSPGHPATHGSLTTAQATLDEETCYPTLKSMQQILLKWLQHPHPIRLAAWTAVVSELCRNADLRMGEIGKRPVASDLILEAFPTSWLARHLPEIASKEPRAFVRKVDGAYIDKHVAYPALACATILAVMFETAEHALHALETADNRFATPHPTRNTSGEALAAFLAGLGLHEACEKFGASIESVEAALRQNLQRQRHPVDTPAALA
ncbi:TniQ family protein [Chromobacterium violaceum]|uniref:TniQ family protein n=1 Tax=Chromobacterium violaceum TaxID=536 RepID=UPI0009DB6051|nr:TniQ family protein [Chromobacterium violaceum]OQS24858.1 hypothetical protein B0T41_14760 [Chromobacterium violaceum]